LPKKRFTPLKTFILGVMNSIPKSLSGYDLITIAKEWHYDHYIKGTNAAFYYTLNLLQEENFIKEIGSSKEGNRPEQTIYKITSRGKQELKEQISHFLNTSQEQYYEIDSVTPFILQFGASCGKDVLLKSLNTLIKARKKSYKHINEGEQLVKTHPFYGVSPFIILPLKHAEFQNDAEIRWLEYFKEIVQNIDNFEENYQQSVKLSMEIKNGEKKQKFS